MQSYNPPTARCRGLGSSHFARHYSGNHDCFLFLPVLRCFSSRGWLSFEYHVFNVMGWPIRRSRDVMLVCSSPWLIAAYHVLLRLSDPRHPPYALNCFKKIKKLKIIVVCYPTTFHQTNQKMVCCKNCDRIVRYSSNIYFSNMSKSWFASSEQADVLDLNQMIHLNESHLKICGGYRSRTDDP